MTQQVSEQEFGTINHIYEDRNGDIWLSTENGIVQLRENIFTNPFSTRTEGYIQDIQVTSDNRIYFADTDKVYLAEKQTKRWRSRIYYDPSVDIRKIVPLPKNTLCIAGYPANLLFIRDGRLANVLRLEQYGREISSVALDGSGSLWVVFEESDNVVKVAPDKVNVQVYSKKKNLSEGILLAKPDPSGNIYLAGTNHNAYLFKYDLQKRTFTNVSKPLPLPREQKR